MATSAIYFTTPGQAQTQVTTLNAAVDGTGTIGTNMIQVLAGSTNGRRISRVRCIHALATAASANKISFFVSYDNGTTKRFLCDVALAAIGALSATQRGGYAEVPELVGKVLIGTTAILYAACWISQAANIDVEYNDA
jgi:hypothetical protein